VRFVCHQLPRPTLSTIKQKNQKGIHYLLGTYGFIFKAIVGIYKATMEVHGIKGPIPITLVEDKTKVKQ
jgi:hypothetical protein